MCGIAGALFQKEATSFPIQAMTEAIKHRGPDDEGYLLLNPWTGNFENRSGKDTHSDLHFPSIEAPWPQQTRLVFGHRRLSILDLSPAGHQPMSDSKKEIWITYNGEIYNYKELRQELENSGIPFFSQTDTEVVLEAYKMWGMGCLHKFNGMWAFALWDSRKKILFCARDRFGVKPFYYAQVKGDFFFASEIKALIRLPQISKEVSEETLFDFLTIGLIQHEAQTFFSQIQALKPGHFLTLNLEGILKMKPWYQLAERMGQNRYDSAAQEEFRQRLSDSVALRLRSDVRVGSCLSGGLDSSAIVCLASRLSSSPLQTFSGCFEDPAFDESAYSASVIRKTGAIPHLVFPSGENFWKEWEELAYYQEEPYGTTSLYSHSCVMREIQRHQIPVLLNGQGGDELLGGYPRYQMNRAISLLFQGKLEGWHQMARHPKALALLVWRILPKPVRQKLFEGLRIFGNGFFHRDVWDRNFKRLEAYYEDRVPRQMSLQDSLRSDFLTYILPGLLRYEDKNSMRFSIETRLPFLDYRLVEWVFGLEESAKVENGISKRILRDSMKGILPEKVRQRRDKMGWSTPEKNWFAMGSSVMGSFFEEPSRSAIAPWVKVEALKKRILQEKTWNSLLWRTVNVEMWFRVFFTSRQPSLVHESSMSTTAARSLERK